MRMGTLSATDADITGTITSDAAASALDPTIPCVSGDGPLQSGQRYCTQDETLQSEVSYLLSNPASPTPTAQKIPTGVILGAVGIVVLALFARGR